MQIVFGVILQAPELAALMGDRDGLDMGEGVGGEQHRTRRQMGDLVDMADEAVEHGWSCRNRADGRGPRASARSCARCPSRGRADWRARCRRRRPPPSAPPSSCRSSAPSNSKAALASSICGPTRGIVLIDGEAAAGPGDAVILLQRRALGQAGAGIGRMDHVAVRAGQAFLQHADIEIARRRGAAGDQLRRAPPCDSRR